MGSCWPTKIQKILMKSRCYWDSHRSTLVHNSCLPIFLQVDTLTFHITLTDFGLTRLISQTSSVGTKTMLAGSPGYQSPEQLRAESIGVECDVYAFGGITYVTITESTLWPGLSYFQIMQKVTSNVEPNTERLPSSFNNICNMCFADNTNGQH